MKTNTTKATIHERGNGLPGAGDLVYDLQGNTVFRIVTPDRSIRITTNGSGQGNSIEVDLEVSDKSDPTEYTDEEWDEISDCGVSIHGEIDSDDL